MKRENVIKFLKLLGAKAPSSQPRAGWTVSECPLQAWNHDGGKSSAEVFGVKDEAGDAHANCFACGWHGKLSTLVLEMRHKNTVNPAVEVDWGKAFHMIEEAEEDTTLDLDFPDIEEMMLGKKNELHEFPIWWLESFPWAWEAPAAVAYLKDRNVAENVWKLLGLRWDPIEQRICFPVLDFNGTLRGLHGRAIKEKVEPRYRMYQQAGRTNPIIWLGEHWVDVERPILVVEGPFDLARVIQFYPNTVTPLFANPSIEKLNRMADALEWVTLLDRGTGGNKGRERITKAFPDHVIKHLFPPEHRKDPGAMTDQELVATLQQAVEIT